MDVSDLIGATGMDANSFRSISDSDFRTLEDYLQGENQPFQDILGTEQQSSSNVSLGLSAISSGLSGSVDSGNLHQVISTLNSSSDPALKQLVNSLTGTAGGDMNAANAAAVHGMAPGQHGQSLGMMGVDGDLILHSGDGTNFNGLAGIGYAGMAHSERTGGIPSPPDSGDGPYSPHNGNVGTGARRIQHGHSTVSPMYYSHHSPASSSTSGSSRFTSDGSVALSPGISGGGGGAKNTAQQLLLLQRQQESLDQLQRSLAEQSVMIAQLSSKSKRSDKSPGSPESSASSSAASASSSGSTQQVAIMQAMLQQQQTQLLAQQRAQEKLLESMSTQFKVENMGVPQQAEQAIHPHMNRLQQQQQSLVALRKQQLMQQNATPSTHHQQQQTQVQAPTLTQHQQQAKPAHMNGWPQPQQHHQQQQQQQQQVEVKVNANRMASQQLIRKTLRGGNLPASGTVQLGQPLHPTKPSLDSATPVQTVGEPLTKKRKRDEMSTSCDDGYIIENDNVSDESDCEDDDDSEGKERGMDAAYQCLKWQTHQVERFYQLAGATYEEMELPMFRVEADKGFSYSVVDDAFVCQKKNHFQVSAIVSLPPSSRYINTRNGYTALEGIAVHAHGIKVEALNVRINIEQSQADRQRHLFQPAPIELNADLSAKVTMGRLHFSKTTANNMRKKNRPNPDQRYFSLVVTLDGLGQDGNIYMLQAQVSERLIVRASNPGQFDNELEVAWPRGQKQGTIFHMGAVGIGTERPDEMLTVIGNARITGNVFRQSDKRLKENFVEISPEATLDNMAKLKLYRYRFRDQFTSVAGMETGQEEVGVIAQELREVLPDAVKEAGDIELGDGEKVEQMLVVNKDRIYMESVGAVKELCRLTDNLETRIHELESLRRKHAKSCQRGHQSDGSIRSKGSYASYLSCTAGGSQTSVESRSGSALDTVSGFYPPPPRYTPTDESMRRKKKRHPGTGSPAGVKKKATEVQMRREVSVCTPGFMQKLIIVLILVMSASIGAMVGLYLIRAPTSNADSGAAVTTVYPNTTYTNFTTSAIGGGGNGSSTVTTAMSNGSIVTVAMNATTAPPAQVLFRNTLPSLAAYLPGFQAGTIDQCCLFHSVITALPTQQTSAATTAPITTAAPATTAPVATTNATPTAPENDATRQTGTVGASSSSEMQRTAEPSTASSSVTAASTTPVTAGPARNLPGVPVTLSALVPGVSQPTPIYPQQENGSDYLIVVPQSTGYSNITLQFQSSGTFSACLNESGSSFTCDDNATDLQPFQSSDATTHRYEIDLNLSLDVILHFRVFLPGTNVSCSVDGPSSLYVEYTINILHYCAI